MGKAVLPSHAALTTEEAGSMLDPVGGVVEAEVEAAPRVPTFQDVDGARRWNVLEPFDPRGAGASTGGLSSLQCQPGGDGRQPQRSPPRQQRWWEADCRLRALLLHLLSAGARHMAPAHQPLMLCSAPETLELETWRGVVRESCAWLMCGALAAMQRRGMCRWVLNLCTALIGSLNPMMVSIGLCRGKDWFGAAAF